MPDSPLNPLNEALPVPDLRRAIHNLQLWISTESTRSEPPQILRFEKDEYRENLADWNTVLTNSVASVNDAEKELRILRGLISHTETVSFIDSHLSRRPLDTPEVSIVCELRELFLTKSLY